MTDTYPDNELSRPSGIKRIFWSGLGGEAVYQTVLTLGGMSTIYISPIGGREPKSAVEPEKPPTGEGFIHVDYENWLRNNNLDAILKVFGHFPTYAEWVKWRQAGGVDILGQGPRL